MLKLCKNIRVYACLNCRQVAHISAIITLGGDWVKRVNLYITDEQEKWLNEQNQKLGLSGKSELVRRILDKEMKKK